MADGDARAVPGQLAGDVEEAAEVAGDDGRRSARGDALRLRRDDRARDVAVLDGEGAPEPAAHVRLVQFDEGQPLDAGEEPARLRPDAELAQPRAGVVVGDGAVKGGVDGRHAEHVDEEARQLVRLVGEGLGLAQPVRVVREELGVVRPDHPGAGAGGDDHVIVGPEGGDHRLREVPRGAPVAGIVGRLAAAGLDGHVDDAARLLQELHRREADRWAQEVDEAGDEQPDAQPRAGPFRGSGHARRDGATARRRPSCRRPRPPRPSCRPRRTA